MNNDDRVRGAVSAILGKLGDKRAVEPLTAALKDTNSAVRAEAAMALRNIGGPEGERRLAGTSPVMSLIVLRGRALKLELTTRSSF